MHCKYIFKINFNLKKAFIDEDPSFISLCNINYNLTFFLNQNEGYLPVQPLRFWDQCLCQLLSNVCQITIFGFLVLPHFLC